MDENAMKKNNEPMQADADIDTETLFETDADITAEPEPEEKKSMFEALEEKMFCIVDKIKGRKYGDDKQNGSNKDMEDGRSGNKPELQFCENKPGLLNRFKISTPSFLKPKQGILEPSESLPIVTTNNQPLPTITNHYQWLHQVPKVVALVAFAVGSFFIYSSIPTHPDIVLGIIMVSASCGILTNTR